MAGFRQHNLHPLSNSIVMDDVGGDDDGEDSIMFGSNHHPSAHHSRGQHPGGFGMGMRGLGTPLGPAGGGGLFQAPSEDFGDLSETVMMDNSGTIGGMSNSGPIRGLLTDSLEAQLTGFGTGSGPISHDFGDGEDLSYQDYIALQQRNMAARSELQVMMGELGDSGSGQIYTDPNYPMQPQYPVQHSYPPQQLQQQHPQHHPGLSLWGSGEATAATASVDSPANSGSGFLRNLSSVVKIETGLELGPDSTLEDIHAVVQSLVSEQTSLGQRIAAVYQAQKQAFRMWNDPRTNGGANAELRQYASEMPTLRSDLQKLVAALEHTYASVILDPTNLQRVLYLKQDLFILHRQIELLVQESQWWEYNLGKPGGAGQHGQSKVPCLCELVVIKQPFPFIVNKNKQLAEDELQVQLISASSTPVASVTPVRAFLSAEAGNVTKGTSVTKPLECDIANIDASTRVAKFPLRFCSGTKKLPARIKFTMQVSLAGSDPSHAYPVESRFSDPFVIITNECQWDDSAGVLMKRDLFENAPNSQVTWASFSNTLQKHFCAATRQELGRPERVLSGQDIAFIHSKYFREAPVVTTRDFDQFWTWFGATMERVRYQRHMCALWQQGLLYGFMTREQANAALYGQDPGTFVIRFSETKKGQYVISYVGSEPGVMKNYLVQPNDTAAAKHTLPDFICEQNQFRDILVLGYNANNEPVFWRSPKTEALAQFSSATSKPVGDDGYDPL